MTDRTTFTDDGRVYASAEPMAWGMVCVEENLRLHGVVRRSKGRPVAYEDLRLFEPYPMRTLELVA